MTAKDVKPIRKPKTISYPKTIDGTNATATRKKNKEIVLQECMTKKENVLTPAASRIAREARAEAAGGIVAFTRLVASGKSFADSAKALGMETQDAWVWIRDNPDHRQAYDAAVEAKAHTQLDKAHDLADRVVDGDLDPRRADVKIKLVQWSAGRTQAYQERKSVEHTVTHRLDLDDLKSRLGQLVDVAASRVIEGEVVHSG